MAIIASELKLYLSGGAANADVNASLGGVISSVEVDGVTALNNLFDDVGTQEATDGDTEYRMVYLKNTNASLTLQNVASYLVSNTTSTDTDLSIGWDIALENVTCQTVADEDTAPSGITFQNLIGSANKVVPAVNTDLTDGAYLGLWVRRVSDPAAGAYASDTATLRFQGDTLP